MLVQVRACCLRGLRVIAERRVDLSLSVANTVLPAFMTVLDQYIDAAVSNDFPAAAAASNVGTTLGALVVLAPLPSFWQLAATQLLHRAVIDGYMDAIAF